MDINIHRINMNRIKSSSNKNKTSFVSFSECVLTLSFNTGRDGAAGRDDRQVEQGEEAAGGGGPRDGRGAGGRGGEEQGLGPGEGEVGAEFGRGGGGAGEGEGKLEGELKAAQASCEEVERVEKDLEEGRVTKALYGVYRRDIIDWNLVI